MPLQNFWFSVRLNSDIKGFMTSVLKLFLFFQVTLFKKIYYPKVSSCKIKNVKYASTGSVRSRFP
jgi:hypothetical protein